MNVLNVSVALVAAVLAGIGTELLGPPEATAQRLVGTVSNHECHDCIPGDGGGGSSLVSEGSAFCIDGFAGSFPCDNVDLAYYYDIADIGGGEGNDCWGWTDPIGGKEYAIYGRTSGTSFIDISDPRNPIYLGNLPPHAGNSEWRDIKVYADHAFLVSEAASSGMQVFDLTQLRSVASPPATFSETAHLSTFGYAHNIAVNEDNGYVYVVGSGQCSGGIYMIDVSTPGSPSSAGCYGGDGYTHDVQCVIYDGPDNEHDGKDICFASNEDGLTIVDVTDKAAPVQLSSVTYAGVGYTHQSWLTEDHAYLLLDDEVDELENGHATRTYIFDLMDLNSPSLSGQFDSTTAAIDHNQYIVGNHSFQANYTAGMRVLNLDAISSGQLCEVAYFDVYPPTDARGFNGAWTSYPFFASGTVIVSAIDGLAIVEPVLAGSQCTGTGASCGNDIREWGELCDGADAEACPGVCDGSCNCPEPVCGNDITESGEACDGVDDTACPGECTGTCTCPVVCSTGDLDVLGLKSDSRRFSMKATLDDASGDYDGADPRVAFLLGVTQGVGSFTIQTPAQQSYWSKSKPAKGRYIWVGDVNGLRKIKVTDRSAKSGLWKIVVKGREVPDADTVDPNSPPEIDISLTMGASCADGVY